MFKGSYDKAYKGLDNSMGANNCFINVIIQSLWHLNSFRRVFKDLEMHKHKKGKLRPKPKSKESDYMGSISTNAGGYPDPSSGGAYPSLEPMAGYPSLGGGGDAPTVPTAGASAPLGGTGYPSPSGYPSLDPMPGPPSAGLGGYQNRNTYTDVSNAAYPSLDGGSATRFHEEEKTAYQKESSD